jgi:hypothetical protein
MVTIEALERLPGHHDYFDFDCAATVDILGANFALYTSSHLQLLTRTTGSLQKQPGDNGYYQHTTPNI